MSSMSTLAALDELGLSMLDSYNYEAIRAAWKAKLMQAHPDKNGDATATLRAQRLNEAKDVLLSSFESELDKLLRAEEDERVAREKERVERERQQKVWDEQTKEMRRKRYSLNRKKRAPGTRVHRKLGDYKEGKELIEEIETFIDEKLESRMHSDDPVMVSDITELFVKSRPSTSELEKRLFIRHFKGIVTQIFSHARYSKHKNKRCFRGFRIFVQPQA